MRDWQNPSYLLHGSEIQRAAYFALVNAGIFKQLSAFSPVLAGTIPLGISIPGSDLDVLCCAPELDRFDTVLCYSFGQLTDFASYRYFIRDIPTIIAHFHLYGFPFEIFAQSVPVERQYGFRHLLVEARLLEIGKEELKKRVLELKLAGSKTEPAFAQILGLAGDPYDKLWELSWLSDRDLEFTKARSAIANLCVAGSLD